MEKIIWTDRVKNEKALHWLEEEWISYVEQNEERLSGLVKSYVRAAFLKHLVEGVLKGRVEGTGDEEEDVRR
jgi:hypothetical protein